MYGFRGMGMMGGLAPRTGVLVPPAGFVFLTEEENGVTYYLTDDDGYFLLEAI